MTKSLILDNIPIIHTTGAFLKPIKVTDSEGKEIWLWYVTEFTDDSFDDDGDVFNPKTTANSKSDLLAEVL
jgi:hypothetical protein